MRLQAHLEQPPQTINKVMGLNLLLRAVSLSVASLLLSCLVLAQGTVGGHPSNPPPPPVRPQTATFDQHRIQLQSNGPQANSSAGDRDACLLPPLTAIPLSTVGVADLKISSKAKKEYAAGCAALKDGKYDKAEESLHKAVGAEPKYVAAWVTLGQLLAGQQKLDDAHQACTQAQTADPKYVPSYLCLADIAARSQNWAETLSMSDRALQIDSANDPVAYDYNAAASLNLHKLDDAEKSALKAIEIDRNHIDSRVHFLLAQIYEAKGQRSKEEAELREYLKYADANDAAMVKQYLSQMEAQPK
jgi:tetratricopeptide (TPR) repeat protein